MQMDIDVAIKCIFKFTFLSRKLRFMGIRLADQCKNVCSMESHAACHTLLISQNNEEKLRQTDEATCLFCSTTEEEDGFILAHLYSDLLILHSFELHFYTFQG